MKARAVRLARELPGILVPLVVTVVVVALALRLLDGVPAYWERLTGPRTAPAVLNERLDYSSLEEAEQDLQVKVALPNYFPSYLAWPASSIRGQKEPARVISLLFRSMEGQQSLQIREIFTQEDTLPFPVPAPTEMLEVREVEVNGTTGMLLVGQGRGGDPVNQLRWHLPGLHLVVTTVYPPEELLRIATSIHPE